MAFPPPTTVGEHLRSQWLNDLRKESLSNQIVSTTGLTFKRTPSGTSVNRSVDSKFGAFQGTLVTVVNLTDNDLKQWYFCGIEKVTDRDKMENNISKGVSYILRDIEAADFPDKIVMLAEPIKKNNSGQAFIRTESVMTRIRYNVDQSEDDLRYATIDTTAEGDGKYVLEASAIGFVAVIDVEEFQSSHEDWRWAVVRFPAATGLPVLFQATDDATNNVINGRRLKSDGSLAGDDQPFFALD